MSKIKDKMIHSLSADKVIQNKDNQMISLDNKKLLELLISKLDVEEKIKFKDCLIDINQDSIDSTPSTGISGVRIIRGEQEPYYIVFDESDDTLKIGTGDNLEEVATKTYIDEQIRLAKLELKTYIDEQIKLNTPNKEV